MICLDTPRLRLTPLAPADLLPFVALHTDARVRRYLGGALTNDRAETRLRDYLAGATSKPVWVLRPKDETRFLGTVDLQPHHDGMNMEISYLLLPDAWGHGYATEAVRALLAHAMDDLGLACVVAETQRANLASCRLLERCGMSRTRRLVRFGAEQVIYTICRPPEGPPRTSSVDAGA
ncbi:MAG: GNAT family N-acetyltransferase [Caldilineaceae bacterium]|nr:GNAT family N-acetyltransferase [Caldilineaceae bacterium]